MKVAVTTLAFCVTSLLAMGLVMLYSSSMTQVGAHYLMMQLIWCVFGFGFCVVAAALDYQLLKKYAWLLFGLAVFLLLLVLVPHIGRKINGARRWFDVHGVRFQPSELGKIALLIALAWYGDRFQRRMATFKWGIIIPVAIIGAILGLIFVEPDRGTTILLAVVSLGMLLIAGADWKKMLLPVPLALAGLAYSIWRDPMRMKRIFSWWNLEQNKDGVGYQAYQAMIALGSGGWDGLGLGNGRQKLGFVPEHHTDFIFSIIGEELGLVATLAVLILFVVIFICGLRIAARAPDDFGRFTGLGITLTITLQAIINLAVVTGSMPTKGIALPFISYGGSSLLVSAVMVGLLINVAHTARDPKVKVRTALFKDRQRTA